MQLFDILVQHDNGKAAIVIITDKDESDALDIFKSMFQGANVQIITITVQQ